MRDPEHTHVLRVVSEHSVPRRRIYLSPGTYLVGSSPQATVPLPVEGLSRRHAELEVLADGGAVLTDLGSRNGTFVGERRIARAALMGGEVLAFGSLAVELVALDPELSRIALRADRNEAPAPRGAIDRPAASTLGLSLEERLIRSLDEMVSQRTETGLGASAAALFLAESWISGLLLQRVEICRAKAIAAVCGEETGSPVELELTGSRDWSLALWGHDTARLRRLEPLLKLALELLDLFSEEAPGIEARRRQPSEIARSLPGAGSHNPEMIRLCRRCAKVAAGDIPILVLGESGSGKEVLARWIHGCSPRAEAPFLALNCAALPRELLEAELFGIEKGVATGVAERRGLIEEAEGGTVLLDEIGDMAPDTQAKVLRVLEDRTLYRVGGRSPVPVDVRFVAATHRDLEARIESGTFRRDLYHRLAAFVVRLPALRERREDVVLLAAHFFHRELEKTVAASPGMTRGALAALAQHSWPGNVRELENEIRKAVLLLEPGEPLDLVHLSDPVRVAFEGAAQAPLSLEATLRRAERQAFATALAAAAGDHVSAMEQLGVSRATFYRKLKELELS